MVQCRWEFALAAMTPDAIAFAGMTPDDLASLQRAVQSLEHPGLAARLTNMVGKPIELIGYALPASASDAISAATSKALEIALNVALGTIHRAPHAGSRLFHKALATASGAAGGAFGLVSLPIELPVSTIIMLRSIAEIARSEGENLADSETALACVQVFALGGPLLVRFIAQVASRFGVAVTQKVAAQAIPVVGALGGAAVNYAFIEHFQDVARGHFTVRRIERIYGEDLVRAEYERLSRQP